MKSRKESIQQSAAKLFREKGYKATSMRNIAEAEGIQAASIYNHIQSKQELLNDLLMNIAQLFVKGMKDINKSSLSSIAKMEKLIALHVQLTISHTDSIALIAGEWIHLEEAALKKYLRLRKAYERDFKKIIIQCKEEDHFGKVDVELALFSTLSTLRWLYSWYSKNKNYNQIELEQQITRILLDGLKK